MNILNHYNFHNAILLLLLLIHIILYYFSLTDWLERVKGKHYLGDTIVGGNMTFKWV